MGVLGLDIGNSHIKAVSVARSGRNYYLDKYAMLPVGDLLKMIISEKKKDFNDAVSMLSNFLKSNGFGTGGQAACVLSEFDFNVYSKVLVMPELRSEDFNKAVEWEAEQHIPLPISEVYLKYTLLRQSSGSNKGNSSIIENLGVFGNLVNQNGSSNQTDTPPTKQVLIIAAEKKLVDRYLSVLKKIGLEVVGMEPTSIASTRSLNASHSLLQSTFIIDIGYSTVDYHLVVDGNLMFSRPLHMGTSTIVRSIMQALNSNGLQSTQMLYKFGVIMNNNNQVYNMVHPTVDKIYAEFIKSLKYVQSRQIYADKNGKNQIRKVILVGSGALIPGVQEYFQQKSGIEFEIGNPWGGIDMQSVIGRDELIKLGPLFVGAIGAALKGFHDE